MTHYDSTMGHDITKDVHCDVTVINVIAVYVHIMTLQYIMMLL